VPDAANYWGAYSKTANYDNYIRIGLYTSAYKALAISDAEDAINNNAGYVLASTWLQCGPGQGIGGPFMTPGGYSNVADVNADTTAVNPDAGVKWWLEAMQAAYGAWGSAGSDGGAPDAESAGLVALQERVVPLAPAARLVLRRTLPPTRAARAIWAHEATSRESVLRRSSFSRSVSCCAAPRSSARAAELWAGGKQNHSQSFRVRGHVHDRSTFEPRTTAMSHWTAGILLGVVGHANADVPPPTHANYSSPRPSSQAPRRNARSERRISAIRGR